MHTILSLLPFGFALAWLTSCLAFAADPGPQRPNIVVILADDMGTPWELYDLEADRTETANRIGQHPEQAKELAAQWHAWATHVGAPK